MKISVVGTGYVGLVSGTCFAELNHEVTCIDIDEKKIQTLKEGGCPIFEPGLTDLMKRNIQAERLQFSTNYDSVKDSQVVFLAVGTPSSDDGQANLKYLYAAAESAINEINDEAIIVIKSTVPVGTSEELKKFLKGKTNKKFYVVNNPEFLKEGAAIDDFMRPDRVVIGSDSDVAFKVMDDVYAPLVRQGNPLYKMSNVSAEMTKYAANCFLATKISFINEIARLCDRTGADINEVRDGIKSDERIGHHFLYPGPGYGGSCFPKDVKALLHTARTHDSPLELVEAAEKVNESQKKYIFDKIQNHFGDLKGKTIAFWGAAFKANTDDIRETAAIALTKYLTEAGASVRFYDPEAADNFKAYMEGMNLFPEKSDDKYDCLSGADALVVVTEWREFTNPDYDKVKSLLVEPTIFDARNLFRTEEVLEKGFTYFAVGKKI
jgi:UDPglucose 6-dehydrogenase